ncbi:hypothetical protein ElyMa_001004500 [Elysia marginata]|uniref:Uncharacterized protein n=1 Tax=Elysia marginata TaxID=1093978 RepID=A0AAV4HL47_9GAST|nr:hypothetical protein ElyMa_001004500 [Elysia marginata]
MQGVAGAYHNSRIACSWVPILQVGGLGKVRVNCFPNATATRHGRKSNPRPPDRESDALTTLPRYPLGLGLLMFAVDSSRLGSITPSSTSHPQTRNSGNTDIDWIDAPCVGYLS